jgi:hypothetical protein
MPGAGDVPPTPLFPGWNTPKGPMPAIFAWKVYVTSTNILTSTAANPRPLSDIPASIIGIIWYNSPPGVLPVYRTLDYGDSRPYTFYLPDGSTRVNSVAINQATYNTFVNAFLAADVYPT